MSTAAVMQKDLDTVSKEFEATVSSLGLKVARGKRAQFRIEKNEAREALDQNRRIINSLKEAEPSAPPDVQAQPLSNNIDRMIIPLPGLDEKRRKKLKALRYKSERLYRRLQLLRPTSEAEFMASLFWMSQKGESRDLDILFKIKTQPVVRLHNASYLLSLAVQEIIKREFEGLRAFFEFSPAQISRVVEATLDKCRRVASLHLKKVFNSETPAQVLARLKELKKTLEDLFEPPRIRQWLETPLKMLDGKSPREGLLEGHTFPILHLLKRFDEGPHY